MGVNYDLLPVNEPKCPYSTYNRDGSMRFDANGGGAPNYEPNSFGGPTEDPKYRRAAERVQHLRHGRSLQPP